MDSSSSSSSSLIGAKKQPHAICVPLPGHGHINPMFKLAKLLHQRGFHITFVNTEFIHGGILKSRGPDSLNGLPSFRFETITDGLPLSDDIPDGKALFGSIATSCLAPFKELLAKLNDNASLPPVSCIVSDVAMPFTLDVAEEFKIPNFIFWATSAYSSMAASKLPILAAKGYLPLKDESCWTNGYLDTVIEDIPDIEGMRLRDLPGYVIATNESFSKKFSEDNIYYRLQKASGIIANTFQDLEGGALEVLKAISPSLIYPVGPLHLLEKQIAGDKDLEELGSNIWKEDSKCLEWLDSKQPSSVLFVNFGTTAFLTHEELIELAWGLANSNQPFLWILRADLVPGEKAVILPPEFFESVKDRGMVVSWCPQEKVLSHHAVGGFWTHGGWNSVLESISCGVPMICCPTGADQPTNSWNCCTRWGIGMETNDMKRDLVERLVRELLTGDKGKEMKKRVMEWKKMAHDAAKNSSLQNLEKVIDELLSPTPKRVNPAFLLWRASAT